MLQVFSFLVRKLEEKLSRIASLNFLRQRPISSFFNPVLTCPILSPSSSNSCPQQTGVSRKEKTLNRSGKQWLWVVNQTSYVISSISSLQSLYRSIDLLPLKTPFWCIKICKHIFVLLDSTTPCFITEKIQGIKFTESRLLLALIMMIKTFKNKKKKEINSGFKSSTKMQYLFHLEEGGWLSLFQCLSSFFSFI